MTTSPIPTLTVRSVKQLLTRAGVAFDDLDIEQVHQSVTISGPRASRSAAADVLYDAGLGNAPHHGLDSWSR